MTVRGRDATFFRPVRPGNAFEDTVERLLQTIRLGVVGPGESLPSERELALRLAVSRDTVREAIKCLADAGYLESRRGRYGGTFVLGDRPEPAQAPATPEEVHDVLALREVLEVGAVRLAAARTLTAGERDLLWTRLADVEAGPPGDYRRRDSRLHITLAELSGSASLVPLVASNRMAVNRLLDEIPLLSRNIAHSDQQHRAVVLAVLAGDPDAAASAMAEHLAGSAALLHGFLG